MEIEHINDDTIRVKIENTDLEERGITFLDLLGNQKQIESFFYSILEEVDIDEEFQESEAVTFQVMPNNNGLELFISKGSHFREDFLEGMGTEGVVDPMSLGNGLNQPSKQEEEIAETTSNDSSTMEETVIVFRNIEQVILMAQEFYLESGNSDLYKYKDQYYLRMVFFVEEMNRKTSDEEVAYALEYGEKAPVAAEVLDEYADKLIEDVALESIRYYFKG